MMEARDVVWGMLNEEQLNLGVVIYYSETLPRVDVDKLGTKHPPFQLILCLFASVDELADIRSKIRRKERET